MNAILITQKRAAASGGSAVNTITSIVMTGGNANAKVDGTYTPSTVHNGVPSFLTNGVGGARIIYWSGTQWGVSFSLGGGFLYTFAGTQSGGPQNPSANGSAPLPSITVNF